MKTIAVTSSKAGPSKMYVRISCSPCSFSCVASVCRAFFSTLPTMTLDASSPGRPLLVSSNAARLREDFSCEFRYVCDDPMFSMGYSLSGDLRSLEVDASERAFVRERDC